MLQGIRMRRAAGGYERIAGDGPTKRNWQRWGFPAGRRRRTIDDGGASGTRKGQTWDEGRSLKSIGGRSEEEGGRRERRRKWKGRRKTERRGRDKAERETVAYTLEPYHLANY